MKAIRYFCIGAVLVVAGLLGARACLTAVWTLPPLPAVPAAPLTTPQRVSTLVLPIRFELAELSRLVNEMVPTHQEGTENSPETRPVLHFHGALRRPTTTREPIAHVDWHVDRGPLQVAGRNDHLQVSATLTGGGRLVPPDLKGSFKGSVSADATVAIGHDYAFVPTVAPDARLDQLKLGFLDVSGLARNKAHQVAASYGPQLSQKIAQAVKFKEHVANAWAALPRSVPIPGARDLWLTLSPSAVLLAGPHVSPEAITASVGLRVALNCSLQPTPPATPPVTALPDSIGSIDDDHFRVVLPVELQLEELNKLISTSLQAHSDVSLPKGGSVHISEVRLLVQNDKLFLQAALEGREGFWARKLKGTIRCGGVPRVKGSPPTLSFGDLSFTQETQSVLVKTAAWLLDPVILKVLQDHATMDLSAQLMRARQEANRMAAKIELPPPLRLQINLDKVEPVQVSASGPSLFACVEASGKAELTLAKP